MNPELLVISVLFGFNAFFTLPTIYQLQIKEYHLPRLVSKWRETKISGEFWIPLRMPAKSMRNLIIFVIVLLGLGVMYYWAWHVELAFGELLLVALFGAIYSKLLAIAGMLLTQPLAYYKSEMAIRKATLMVGGSDTIFIGITGSYGKTSVREYLYEILAAKFNVEKNIGSFNAPDGVAYSVIRNLKDETQFFVTEMGAYHKGIIAKSAAIVKPKYGIITGLGNQHLDLFGSRHNLIEGKSELFDALPEDGVAYINIDCEGWEQAIKHAKCRVVKYSQEDERADLLVEEWLLQFAEENNISNIVNLLPVIALALELGMSLQEVKDAMQNLNPLSSKLSLHRTENNNLILNDSYNSNVEGFLTAIHKLQALEQEKKIIVSKGIIELGSEKEDSYRKICADINESSYLITSDKLLASLCNNSIYLQSERDMLAEIERVKGDSYALLIEGRCSPWMLEELGIKIEAHS